MGLAVSNWERRYSHRVDARTGTHYYKIRFATATGLIRPFLLLLGAAYFFDMAVAILMTNGPTRGQGAMWAALYMASGTASLAVVWVGLNMRVAVGSGQLSARNGLRSTVATSSQIASIDVRRVSQGYEEAWIPLVKLADGSSITLRAVTTRGSKGRAAQCVAMVDDIRSRLNVGGRSPDIS